MRANESSGQCQRYRGKLIRPIPISQRLSRIIWLIKASGPESTKSAAPNVGMIASHPGNGRSPLNKKNAPTTSANPSVELVLAIQRFSAEELEGDIWIER